MRKKLLSFAAIAAIVFFGACSNEELTPEQDLSFEFSASINPSTRVTANEESDSVLLRWESTDAMNFVATQGGNTAFGTATINPGSISSDGKRALFTTNPAAGSQPINTAQPFNFYGVYGGGGLSPSNLTNGVLPTNLGDATSLEDIANENHVMLYFNHENIVLSELATGVTLNHLGSIFKITLRNDCPTGILNLESGASLEGQGTNQDWAYNSVGATGTFDLVNKSFQNMGTGINNISFSTDKVTIAPGEEATYWSWYPVEEDVAPELKLVLVNANPNGNLTTVNSKASRTFVAGTKYAFYAAFDGTNLNFTNSDFSEVTP